ncbi:MAG: hypothetical protein PUE67_00760 [Oscillospiraceae bacterium]|nr:hypothetical protein [Oscillospiraceae bacterium]
MNNQIVIKGDSPDKKEVEMLLKNCVSSQSLETKVPVTLVLDNAYHDFDIKGALAVPASNKMYDGGEKLTYSTVNQSADVVGLNIQDRENQRCFELLYGAEMGRIFVSKSKDIAIPSVVAAASALIAGKIPVKKVIEEINNQLK